jgi:hypothetical protein
MGKIHFIGALPNIALIPGPSMRLGRNVRLVVATEGQNHVAEKLEGHLSHCDCSGHKHGGALGVPEDLHS